MSVNFASELLAPYNRLGATGVAASRMSKRLGRASTSSRLLVLGSMLALLGCSTGSGSPRDHFGRTTGTGGASNGSDPAINGDAAAEAQADLCVDPIAVTKPYRGANLTGMGMKAYGWDVGYTESDFSSLHELGFNWVRLPIDYLNYTVPEDWSLYDPVGLNKIDQAVALGCKYGVHVCLNLYQAPGYSVATAIDPSGLVLWKDAAAQAAFAAHWQMFARRYAQVPADNLSFNLVNEPPAPPSTYNPSGVDEGTYLNVMQQAVKLIRVASPSRPVLLDGLNFGRVPLTSLTDTSIIQAVHDYDPIQVTHYKASWVDGSSSWPVPQWPPFMAPHYLFGPLHSDAAAAGPGKDYCQLTADGNCSALTLTSNFPSGTTISVTIHQVSYADDTVANAAPTRLTILEKNSQQPLFEQEYSVQNYPADQAPCDNSCANSTYHVLQPVLDQVYSVTLLTDVQSLSILTTSGDWVYLSNIDITPPSSSAGSSIRLVPEIQRWDVPQVSYRIDSAGVAQLIGSPPEGYEQDFNPVGWLDAWKQLRQSGVSVMVGEFGVYNQTSQDVTLAWFKDQLTAFQQGGFSGWATWDIYSEFGVLGPVRPGETSETYLGRPLNRPMLNLLMQY